MDTTAKVDIRKLQLLNDRIAQTIEALNQVRLSVHGLGGLSHTSGVPFGNAGYGVPGIQGFQGLQGINPFQGNVPYGYNQNLAALNGGYGVPGISHTSPFGYPQQQLGGWPLQQGLPLQQLWGQGVPQQFGQFGQFGQGVPQQFGGFGGISHSSPELDLVNRLGVDPITAARIAQAFPYAMF